MKYARNIFYVAITLFFCFANASPTKNQLAISTYLIGTNTDSNKQGIELLSLTEQNKLISSKVIASGFSDPSFLVANRAMSLVFAVESTVDGEVSSFALNQDKKNLLLLSKVKSFGDYPCYIALDNSERFLAVANYTSGNFSLYEIDGAGKLHFKQSIQHIGSSINKVRQDSAHIHSMIFHPNGKQLLVADLGTDKIHIYDVDFSSATPIKQANPAYLKVAVGSGPRHMVMHPNGKILYLVHELTGEIGVYFYENENITHVNTHSLTSPTFNGDVQAAEVRISADGQFLYVSNRGSANTLSVFEVHQKGGLRLLQQISTGGLTPRNFNLSLDGHFLLVANQDSNEVRIFQRDLLTGLLTATATKINIQKPTYILPL
jgi:6-phosphogluconolactonase